jgi:4-amino-4-deoxy-L-arabinose transferase-like glycosyltransferase
VPDKNYEALTSKQDSVEDGAAGRSDCQTVMAAFPPEKSKNNVNGSGEVPAGVKFSLFTGEFIFLVIVCVSAFAWKAISVKNQLVISADGTSYCLSGKNFFRDGNLNHFGTVFPPLYPFLIGLFDLFMGNLELAARYVSVLFSTLTIIPVYLAGRVVLGRVGAAITCCLFSLLPLVHAMSTIDIAEPVYTFFMLSGALLFWSGTASGRLSKRKLYSSGLLLGLAYLARPEAFVTLFSLSLFMTSVCLVQYKSEFKALLIGILFAWAGFFTMGMPYMAYLHSVTGAWQLSGKTGTNVNAIKEFKGLAISDQRFQLNDKGEFVHQDGSLTGLIREEPRLFMLIVKKNVEEFIPALKSALPTYLWPFVLAGFFLLPWRGDGSRYRFFLLGTLAPLLLYLVFYIVSRYLYPYLPLLLILFTYALLRLDRTVAGRLGIPPAWTAVTVAFLLGGNFIFAELPRPLSPYNYEQDGGRFDDKQVGLRIKQILPKGSILMTRSGRVSFYADMPMVIPPQAAPVQIMEYAHKHKVTHLVANIQLMNMRPQLEYLFTPLIQPDAPFSPPVGMEIVYIGQEPGGLPYIIYRLL